MMAGSSRVTRKGQITIPISIRQQLGIKEGDTLVFENRGDHVAIRQPETIGKRTAGALAKYAHNLPPLKPNQISELAELYIAEEGMQSLKDSE